MKKCTYCGQECEDNAVNCSGCGLDTFDSDGPAPAEQGDEADDLVTLRYCPEPAQVDQIVSVLDPAGIDTFTSDRLLGDTDHTLIQVHQPNFRKAKDLIAEIEAAYDRAAVPEPPAPGEQRVIASMVASQTGELLERLKQAGIPFEIRTSTQEMGLEETEVLVLGSDFDRGCDVVEAWAEELRGGKSAKVSCNQCGSQNMAVIPHDMLGSVFQCQDCGLEFPRPGNM